MPTLLIDSGNILFKTSKAQRISQQDILSAKTIIEIYRMIGYSAIAIGPYDLSAGVELLQQSVQEGAPWVSANILSKTNTLVFPPWKMLKTDNGIIGIIGLTSQQAILPEGYQVAGWKTTLPEHVNNLQQKCDFLILLSNLSDQENKEITARFPKLHLLISANRKSGNVTPQLQNNTLRTQTHSKGKYLGLLSFHWPDDNSFNQTPMRLSEPTHTSRFKALTLSVPEDQTIKARLERLKKEIANSNKRIGSSRVEPDARTNSLNHALPEIFTGPESCRSCHEVQYSKWQQTAHATAMESLTRENQQFNLDCLSCHVTHRMDAEAEQPKSYLIGLPKKLQAVTCESCHGPAADHVTSEGNLNSFRKVSTETCLICHTEERTNREAVELELMEIIRCTDS